MLALGRFRGRVSVEVTIFQPRRHPPAAEPQIHPRNKKLAPERDLVRLSSFVFFFFFYFFLGVEHEGGHLDGVTLCRTRRPSCPSSGAERSWSFRECEGPTWGSTRNRRRPRQFQSPRAGPVRTTSYYPSTCLKVWGGEGVISLRSTPCLWTDTIQGWGICSDSLVG